MYSVLEYIIVEGFWKIYQWDRARFKNHSVVWDVNVLQCFDNCNCIAVIKCLTKPQVIRWFPILFLNSTGHQVSHLYNSHNHKCNADLPSKSGEPVQLMWISSEFIMRVLKICWKLLEPTSSDSKQVIQRVMKVIDALLYMQGEMPFKIPTVGIWPLLLVSWHFISLCYFMKSAFTLSFCSSWLPLDFAFRRRDAGGKSRQCLPQRKPEWPPRVLGLKIPISCEPDIPGIV